jgi:hypothetical protein
VSDVDGAAPRVHEAFHELPMGCHIQPRLPRDDASGHKSTRLSIISAQLKVF